MTSSFTRLATASFLACLIAGPLSPEPARAAGLAGAYLAGKHAIAKRDIEAAARYFTRTLSYDSANPGLMEQAMAYSVAAGDMTTAAPLARRLADLGEDETVTLVHWPERLTPLELLLAGELELAARSGVARALQEAVLRPAGPESRAWLPLRIR